MMVDRLQWAHEGFVHLRPGEREIGKRDLLGCAEIKTEELEENLETRQVY